MFINFVPCRYDVEIYQRIEQLIGKRLPKFDVVDEEVMMLVERVTEAQRFAKLVSDRFLSISTSSCNHENIAFQSIL